MKTKVGKLFRASVLAAAIGLPGAAFAQDLDTLTTKDLVPLAVKEGSVTVFSLSSRIARIEKAFEAAYPGIDLIGLDMSSTKQIARVEAEQQAGVNAVDVLYIADTPVVFDKLLEEISILKPSHIALQTQLGDFDQGKMLRQIELWGSKIIPAVKRELKSSRAA